MDIYCFLKEKDISYQRADHPPVYTYQEAEDQVSPLPGAHTKNLFLRDGKGRRHFLIVVEGAMQVDLKALRVMLAADKLGMASPERLKKTPWRRTRRGDTTRSHQRFRTGGGVGV